jgi:SM-20-related protein
MTHNVTIPPVLHNAAAIFHARIAEDLFEKGWSVQPDYLGIGLAAALKTRMAELEEAEALTPAGIGREDQNRIAEDIRRDRTFWLDPAHSTDREYTGLMENLRLCLNRDLFLGLFEYEAHYAMYPAGGFYKKHIDALKGGKNRIVSTVCYLNEEWREKDGGMLTLFDRDDHSRVVNVVLPEEGSIAVFLSEDIPHEVTPANRVRRSIAGWFRCNNSSAERADPLI